nr:MAG TPA: hypothetical protein [Caudoviricetes sp.]
MLKSLSSIFYLPFFSAVELINFLYFIVVYHFMFYFSIHLNKYSIKNINQKS